MSFGDTDALAFAAKNDAALCTIVGIDGSFSRRLGAQLAIDAEGRCVGDLADACLHNELANRACEARVMGKPMLLRYGRGSPYIDFRLPCGAGLDIVVDPFPDRVATAECFDEIQNRQRATLDIPKPDGWHGGLISSRVFLPDLRLVLLGNGSECRAMRKLATAQDIACEFREPGHGVSLSVAPADLSVDSWTAILLLFHEHEWEAALLDWAIDTPAFYIGAQGGAPARVTRAERLANSGRTDQQIARMSSPIGLIPRTRSAELLALSAMAEIAGCYNALQEEASMLSARDVTAECR